MNNNEHQVNFASHNDNNNFVRKTWGWGGDIFSNCISIICVIMLNYSTLDV